jgi:transposase
MKYWTKKKYLRPEQMRIMDSMKRHWKGLTLFVKYPEIPKDNNFVERIERSMVLGRKNCWENHSEWGGEFSAIMLSVIQTCVMHKISPKAHCLHRIFTTQTLIP